MSFRPTWPPIGISYRDEAPSKMSYVGRSSFDSATTACHSLRKTLLEGPAAHWIYRSYASKLSRDPRQTHDGPTLANDIYFSQSEFFIKIHSMAGLKMCVVKIGAAADGRFSWRLLYDALFSLV